MDMSGKEKGSLRPHHPVIEHRARERPDDKCPPQSQLIALGRERERPEGVAVDA